MTHEKTLKLLRMIINQTDLETSDWTDEELTAAMEFAAAELGMRRIARFSTITINSEIDSGAYGIVPELTVEEGVLLANKTAIAMLKQDYSDKLNRGAIGMSWRSGLEEASTISAEKAWQNAIVSLERNLLELIAIHLAPNAGFRSQ